MKRFIRRIKALFAICPLAFACTLTPEAKTVLDCKARLLLPYVTEESEQRTLVRELVRAADTGSKVDLEKLLLDVGLTAIELAELQLAYESCEVK